MMYTTSTGQWNTKHAISDAGIAKHHVAKKTLTASYLASPPAGNTPQVKIVLYANANM